MAFVLNSNISIGPYEKVKVNNVKVTHSVFDFVSKATIKIPTSARIAIDGFSTQSIQTINFTEGDKVIIELGYNGALMKEFEGFVHSVNFGTPLIVNCEGYSYQLRKRTYNKTFKGVKLYQLLKELCNGTDIIVSASNVVDTLVDKLPILGLSGTEALEAVKKHFDGTILIWLDGKILYADFFPLKAVTQKKETAYRIGWNVIKADDLKKRDAKNYDVQVVYEAVEQDGTIKTATGGRLKNYKSINKSKSGTTGEIKRKTVSVTNSQGLHNMATAKHTQLTYTGYQGKITAFLQPYCAVNEVVRLTDAKFKERNGRYLINAVEVEYGMSGGRRIIDLGIQL